MIVGTLVTVVAAWSPSRKAAKVAPIAAIRDVAFDSSGTSMRRASIRRARHVVGAMFLGSGLSAGARARSAWARWRCSAASRSLVR